MKFPTEWTNRINVPKHQPVFVWELNIHGVDNSYAKFYVYIFITRRLNQHPLNKHGTSRNQLLEGFNWGCCWTTKYGRYRNISEYVGISMDWFKGKPTGNHWFFHEIWGFPGCPIDFLFGAFNNGAATTILKLLQVPSGSSCSTWRHWKLVWWYTYPSEKYDFVSWDCSSQYIWEVIKKKHVPNHQPVNHACSNCL